MWCYEGIKRQITSAACLHCPYTAFPPSFFNIFRFDFNFKIFKNSKTFIAFNVWLKRQRQRDGLEVREELSMETWSENQCWKCPSPWDFVCISPALVFAFLVFLVLARKDWIPKKTSHRSLQPSKSSYIKKITTNYQESRLTVWCLL